MSIQRRVVVQEPKSQIILYITPVAFEHRKELLSLKLNFITSTKRKPKSLPEKMNVNSK